MTLFERTIKGRVAGDDHVIKRTVKDLPAGTALSKAWLTVKESLDDADGSAVVQKEITTTETADGEIEDDGSSDQEGLIRFDLAPADTTAIGTTDRRHYDIQVKLDDGKVETLEVGRIWYEPGATDATS